MADKRQVKKTIRQLQRVRTWQLLVILLLLGFVSATFLRLNNIGMTERREAVFAIDKSGDLFSLQNRLFDLQRYAATHMNAATGPVYLEGQYQRDVDATVSSAKDTGAPEENNMSAQVDAICRARNDQAWLSMTQYALCWSEEMAKFPPSSDPGQNVALPNADLYRHDFMSPRWSPDFAGWSLLACAVVALMIFVRLASLFVLKMVLRSRYKSI